MGTASTGSMCISLVITPMDAPALGHTSTSTAASMEDPLTRRVPDTLETLAMLRPLEELPRLTSATHSLASLGRTLSLDGPWLSMLTRMTSDRVVMSCQGQQEMQAL